jgi:hypothetical protein
LERIENFYLKLLRIFLVIFSTFALVYAIINFTASLTDIADQPNVEQVDLPKWSDLRYEILPIKQSQEEESVALESSSSPAEVADKILFNSELTKVIQNLKKLFSLSQINFFEENLSLEILDGFRNNIPDIYLKSFTTGLVELSFDLSEDNLLKRIEDPQRKMRLILDSLDLYKFSFLESSTEIQNINYKAIQDSQQINADGYASIIFSAYALALFIIFLLYILILKVEYNLRMIAPAITNKES